MARKFYLTTVIAKVITEEPIAPDAPLSTIEYIMDEGGGMGDVETSQDEIDATAAAQLSVQFGGDPSFFNLDDKGNDLKED